MVPTLVTSFFATSLHPLHHFYFPYTSRLRIFKVSPFFGPFALLDSQRPKPTGYASLNTIFHAAPPFTPRCLYMHLSLSSKQLVLTTHIDYYTGGLKIHPDRYVGSH